MLSGGGARGGDDDDIEELAEGLLSAGGLKGASTLPDRMGSGGAAGTSSDGGGDPLVEARRALSLANAPSELPCRDTEKARITKFVEDIIGQGEGIGEC